MEELAAIVIFVLVMLGFAGFGLYKGWALTQRWGYRPEQVEARRRKRRQKRGEVEPDAGAYLAWKVEEHRLAERQWMEAWVSLLPVEEKRYITDYMYSRYGPIDPTSRVSKYSGYGSPEWVEQEILERLVRTQRQMIINRTGGRPS